MQLRELEGFYLVCWPMNKKKYLLLSIKFTTENESIRYQPFMHRKVKHSETDENVVRNIFSRLVILSLKL